MSSPIYKTNLEFKRFIWDAIYFSQNRNNHYLYRFWTFRVRLKNIGNSSSLMFIMFM